MCDCIRLVNAELAKHNTAVDVTIAVQQGELTVMGMEIGTHLIVNKPRTKPMRLTAAFCPICGQKYDIKS